MDVDLRRPDDDRRRQCDHDTGAVEILETFELKIALGSRAIQHTVRARRLGDCS